MLSAFSSYKIQQVSRAQNTQVDALARLACTKDDELLEVILVEFLNEPSIQSINQPLTINCVTTTDNWMTPIVQYLKDGQFPKDKKKARLLRLKAASYILYDGQLYRTGFSTSLLKCVDLEEGNYILQEIHERGGGFCNNHVRGHHLPTKRYERDIFGQP